MLAELRKLRESVLLAYHARDSPDACAKEVQAFYRAHNEGRACSVECRTYDDILFILKVMEALHTVE